MTDLVQNDWDLVEAALTNERVAHADWTPPALEALYRLRESNRSMVSGLIERIEELEAQLAEVQRQEWPRPSNL